MRLPLLGAAALLVGLTGGAFAQDPSVPLKGRETDPNMPAQQAVPPERVRPQDPSSTGTTTEGRGSLSDKLERSDGVLRPPANAGTGTVIAPPATNSEMPVIRPPGTTSDAPIQPK
jgi:hypothetical protein